MEIRVGGPGQEPQSVAVTMRTPGKDFELAAGFLFTEGLIAPGDITKVSYCDTVDTEQRFNIVTVRIKSPFDVDALKRNFYATSSCGICGKASLESVEVRCEVVATGPIVSAEIIGGLDEELRAAQRVFEATGGLHAAGLFDSSGDLVALREDVGRHNAVDKVIGHAMLGGAPKFGERVLMVSGRASFEIVQKAAVAGIPMVCAVSAPTSLAVDAAEELGLTLIGFLRAGAFNIYSHAERVAGI
jgi:FdhD protein